MTDICQSCCRESSLVRDGLCRQCRVRDAFGSTMATLANRLEMMTDEQVDEFIERYRALYNHVAERSAMAESPIAARELVVMSSRIRMMWQRCVEFRMSCSLTLPSVTFDL